MDKGSTDLFPGALDLLILRVLSRGTLHGYGIARRIEEAAEQEIPVPEGTLYPALQRLLIEGYVTAEWGTSETGRRARFYKLTPDGRAQFRSATARMERNFALFQRVLGAI